MVVPLLLAVQAWPIQLPLSETDPILAGANYGAYVCDLADGKPLFALNESRRLIPASNQKILSTLFALATLGPEFRPQTRFWKSAEGTWVDATGDPTITSAQLADIAKRLGTDPKLPVFVRQAYRPGVPPSWEADDLPNKYAAQVTALTVDKNSFEVWWDATGPRPLPDWLGVRQHQWVNQQPAAATYDLERRLVRVTGSSTEPRRLETLAIPEPDRAAARILGKDLVSVASVPDRTPDYIHLGPKLIEIVRDCLVPSDNNYAENLLLMAGGSHTNPENPYPQATAKFREFLTHKVGLLAGTMRPDDGSGMSRHNLVTTEGIAKLLVWARKQPWGTAYAEAMAKPGIGTLRTRLQGLDVRGKTGTLDMVHSLSGYLRSSSGREVVFSVILNHSLASGTQQHAVLDACAKRIQEFLETGTNRAYQSTNGDRSKAVSFKGAHAFAGNRVH